MINQLKLYFPLDFSGPNIRLNNAGNEPPSEESMGIMRHSGPANTRYSTPEARLRTFKDWPPALKQEPKQLADAGFYYIGLSDQTKCFYCEGGLRNWQPEDDPWTEHARWFSKCGYVRLIKGDDFIAKCLNERPPQPPMAATGSSNQLTNQQPPFSVNSSKDNERSADALSAQLEQARIIPNPTESQNIVSCSVFIFVLLLCLFVLSLAFLFVDLLFTLGTVFVASEI